MENKYTLSSFTDYELTYWDIPKTKANHNKFRIFFTRMLKKDPDFVKRDVWNNAETVKVGKTKARQFSSQDLSLLAQKSNSYLEKEYAKEHPDISEDILKIREQHKENISMFYNDEKIYLEERAKDENFKKTIESYTQKIMLTALFEHFYTPIDIDKVTNDFVAIGQRAEIGESAEQQLETPALNAQYRIAHPKGNYFSEKDQSLKDQTKK